MQSHTSVKDHNNQFLISKTKVSQNSIRSLAIRSHWSVNLQGNWHNQIHNHLPLLGINKKFCGFTFSFYSHYFILAVETRDANPYLSHSLPKEKNNLIILKTIITCKIARHFSVLWMLFENSSKRNYNHDFFWWTIVWFLKMQIVQLQNIYIHTWRTRPSNATR